MVVGSTPVEEVEYWVVKEVRVFFREELVEEPWDIVVMEDLVVAEVLVVYLEGEEVVVEVVVEGTLVEAVEIMLRTPVGEGEDLTTPEQIRKMTVVSRQPAMVR